MLPFRGDRVAIPSDPFPSLAETLRHIGVIVVILLAIAAAAYATAAL